MAGGIRYAVCCDDCGIDVRDDLEYQTEATARAIRDWAATAGGWLLRHPNTDNQWLSCPECAAAQYKLSDPPRRLSLVRE